MFGEKVENHQSPLIPLQKKPTFQTHPHFDMLSATLPYLVLIIHHHHHHHYHHHHHLRLSTPNNLNE
ncbi:hypothetical protein VNO80_23171 [Phaseolus coccineus]|uniref:Uncharacterized protein n=1 Tax=Phaseolus coccineus TaxID=3886 RepID=A0AAN9MAY9_PHACN